jgi:hypothetical protein
VAVAGLSLAMSLGTVAGAAGVTAHATVTVNPAQHYQSIAGFGVSEGFGQAKALMNAPASVQDQVLSLLYSPSHEAGLTILRNEISADGSFTIEPTAPSGPTAKPSYLSLAQVDQDQGQLWFAKRVKADYGVSDVFADAWSAPAFMKTNGDAALGSQAQRTPANCSRPGAQKGLPRVGVHSLLQPALFCLAHLFPDDRGRHPRRWLGGHALVRRRCLHRLRAQEETVPRSPTPAATFVRSCRSAIWPERRPR